MENLIACETSAKIALIDARMRARLWLCAPSDQKRDPRRELTRALYHLSGRLHACHQTALSNGLRQWSVAYQDARDDVWHYATFLDTITANENAQGRGAGVSANLFPPLTSQVF
jgi:hypothetical protein